MSTTPASTIAPLPASGAAVVPGVSAAQGTGQGLPIAPPLPGAPAPITAATPAPGATTIGGGAPADQSNVVATLQALVAVLTQLAALQGAQGAASVQGGGAAGGPSSSGMFGTTVMGSFSAIGSTPLATSSFGGGSTVGGVVLGGVPGTATSLSGGSVPAFLPSLGAITGGGAVLGGTASVIGGGASVVGGGASVIGGGGSFGAPAATGASGMTIGGYVLGGSPTPAPTPVSTAAPAGAAPAAPVTGGGGAAAPAATPQVDMRRLLGTPRPGDVIATILRSATASALPSKSEGQYIVIQDANGAQLQAHVHGAWSSHPTRILEGIQRGYVQVHVHEDGTLHLHDVA